MYVTAYLSQFAQCLIKRPAFVAQRGYLIPQAPVCLQELGCCDSAEPRVLRHALRCQVVDLLVEGPQDSKVRPAAHGDCVAEHTLSLR